jgi:hypothetical protein
MLGGIFLFALGYRIAYLFHDHGRSNDVLAEMELSHKDRDAFKAFFLQQHLKLAAQQQKLVPAPVIDPKQWLEAAPVVADNPAKAVGFKQRQAAVPLLVEKPEPAADPMHSPQDGVKEKTDLINMKPPVGLNENEVSSDLGEKALPIVLSPEEDSPAKLKPFGSKPKSAKMMTPFVKKPGVAGLKEPVSKRRVSKLNVKGKKHRKKHRLGNMPGKFGKYGRLGGRMRAEDGKPKTGLSGKIKKTPHTGEREPVHGPGTKMRKKGFGVRPGVRKTGGM